MLARVFKNLRFDLLQNNSFGKYFKYAIGEIILVVIGILLALQINTWNQDRINKRRGNVFLQNLKIDLNKQLDDINIQMTFEVEQASRVQNILNQYYDDLKFELDTAFFNSTSRLIGRKTFNKNAPTFTAMLSTGNISLIRDENLKKNLIDYYHDLEQLENMLRFNNTFFVDQIYKPTILNNSYYYSPQLGWNEKLAEIAQKQLNKEDRELMIANSIAHRAVISNNNIKYLERLKEDTDKIIKLIDDILVLPRI